MNTLQLVRPHLDDTWMGGSRVGTVRATKAELIAELGDPVLVDTADGKVNYRWVFDTPRGLAEIRDYWWNQANEHTIAADCYPGAPGKHDRAGLWLARYLRQRGMKAGRGME